MLTIHLRLVIIILGIGLISYPFGDDRRLAYATSDNLVWKPYLQQLTPTSVIILWTTKTGTTSKVRYATDTGYGSEMIGTSRRLSQLGLQVHRVELSGLHPNTTYFYKIYTENVDLLPDEALSLKTAPYLGSLTSFTFLAFGDYGKNGASQRALRDQMVLDSFDFILTTGDNAYPDGAYNHFDKSVFQIYGDIFKRAAVFPTLGNHDYRTSNAAPYLDLFELPAQAWQADHQERYYSFDYGNAHFIGLDSDLPLDANDATAEDDMFDWLRADLSQTTQPWRIVAFHHAPYSTGKSHGSYSPARTKLVPIFEEYGVDLVLNGHDHIYQRSKPLRAGQETPVAEGGIVYIVTGAGSRASDDCNNASWSVIRYCSETYGLYSRITIAGNQLIGEAIDAQGGVKDYFIIENGPLVVKPIEDVSINGPTAGAIERDYTFRATIDPLDTTLPVTYTWQATGQPPITHVDGLSDIVTYTWASTGTQTITVTATNIDNTVTDIHTVTITLSGPTYYHYLPAIWRDDN